MKCNHCNGEHPDGFNFCPVTGKEIVQSKKACANPGCVDFGKYILPVDALFCPRCGQRITSDSLSSKSDITVFSVNGVEFEMVHVEGGSFDMGSEDSDPKEEEYDPVHRVILSSYRIGKYPVTQELWEAVMGSNPSEFYGPCRPVENVSWYDCQQFLCKLNHLTGEKFKLPTEAQWEFAARGGNDSDGHEYSGSDDINKVTWYRRNSDKMTHDVGELLPNELGIYDMSGNVDEWCADRFGTYCNSLQTDPKGSSSGSYRVVRGGSWDQIDWCCRVAFRNGCLPDERLDNLGFRLCL